MSNISNIDFENLSRDDLIAILECKKADILELMSLANSKREHNYVTYSKTCSFHLLRYAEMIVDTVHSSKAQMTLMQSYCSKKKMF